MQTPQHIDCPDLQNKGHLQVQVLAASKPLVEQTAASRSSPRSSSIPDKANQGKKNENILYNCRNRLEAKNKICHYIDMQAMSYLKNNPQYKSKHHISFMCNFHGLSPLLGCFISPFPFCGTQRQGTRGTEFSCQRTDALQSRQDHLERNNGTA